MFRKPIIKIQLYNRSFKILRRSMTQLFCVCCSNRIGLVLERGKLGNCPEPTFPKVLPQGPCSLQDGRTTHRTSISCIVACESQDRRALSRLSKVQGKLSKIFYVFLENKGTLLPMIRQNTFCEEAQRGLLLLFCCRRWIFLPQKRQKGVGQLSN